MKTMKRAFRAAGLCALATAALSGSTVHAAVSVGDAADVRYMLPAVTSIAETSRVLTFAGDERTVLIQEGIGPFAEGGETSASWPDAPADTAVPIGDAMTLPEATTWALMIAGFGLIGGAMRHQRRRITVAYA